ncbi:MAG: metal ABC transporter ATP-binding protein [Oscillospiraceae bacterium]|nr:metal ABC transporter ATP-binding protein [Oscillospiraceae bacterium]
MPLITVKNLTVSYENRVVLSDLSFSVEAGDYLCVVGENGSGKSTLIKALLALKKTDGGGIVFGEGLQRREIGYLPQQNGAHKDFPASVWEVVLSGCQNSRGIRPFYTKNERQRARAHIEKLGIADLKKRCFRELSGGQQQRVLLARALCAAGRLLILDEPVTGLDPVAAAEFYRLLALINKEGITVVMVSHDVKSAVRFASHILHLQNKPLFFGPAAAYAGSEVGQRFLGSGEDVCHH